MRDLTAMISKLAIIVALLQPAAMECTKTAVLQKAQKASCTGLLIAPSQARQMLLCVDKLYPVCQSELEKKKTLYTAETQRLNALLKIETKLKQAAQNEALTSVLLSAALGVVLGAAGFALVTK